MIVINIILILLAVVLIIFNTLSKDDANTASAKLSRSTYYSLYVGYTLLLVGLGLFIYDLTRSSGGGVKASFSF